MTLFNDKNGKISGKRVAGFMALIFAMVISFTEAKGLVSPFLLFAGGCFGISVLERAA